MCNEAAVEGSAFCFDFRINSTRGGSQQERFGRKLCFRGDLHTELSTAGRPRAGCVLRSERVLTELLFLGLEQALVLLNELFDLPSHTKNLPPLLFVQRHRKSAHPIQRQPTLLADLQAQPAHTLVLQLLVLCPKALKLCSQIFVRHEFFSTRRLRHQLATADK